MLFRKKILIAQKLMQIRILEDQARLGMEIERDVMMKKFQVERLHERLLIMRHEDVMDLRS